MKIFYLLLFFATAAHADIYKSIDSNGNVTFSDHPVKGAEKLSAPPAPVPRRAAPEEAPVEVPSETPARPSEKQDATEVERKALQDQLDDETRQLENAKAELKAAQEVISSTDRNSQADIDRTAAIQDEIDKHEKAIEDLRKRISDLK